MRLTLTGQAKSALIDLYRPVILWGGGAVPHANQSCRACQAVTVLSCLSRLIKAMHWSVARLPGGFD